MDCRSARLLHEFARPAEHPNPGQVDDLQQHLAGCPECASWSQREQGTDEVVSKAMRQVVVPEMLKGRIQAALLRDRRVARRRIWTRYGSSVAAAAALLLACWFGFDWYQRQPAALDIEKISNDVFMVTANPSPDAVEGWFLQRGVDIVPPPNFNYALLSYYDFTTLHDKRTPLLVFTQGSEQARVFVLSDRQFDLREALANRQDQGSGCRAAVLPHPTDKRFAYLVVYNGESLDPFLAKAN